MLNLCDEDFDAMELVEGNVKSCVGRGDQRYRAEGFVEVEV